MPHSFTPPGSSRPDTPATNASDAGRLRVHQKRQSKPGASEQTCATTTATRLHQPSEHQPAHDPTHYSCRSGPGLTNTNAFPCARPHQPPAQPRRHNMCNRSRHPNSNSMPPMHHHATATGSPAPAQRGDTQHHGHSAPADALLHQCHIKASLLQQYITNASSMHHQCLFNAFTIIKA